jgi:hypothetical protein
MKTKEPKDETVASSSVAADAEVANRRSFMKTLAAGTVAAGTLAGITAKATTPTTAQTIYAQRLGVQARKPTAVLRRGFDGLDFLLRLDDIITPAQEGFVATLEGELVSQ